MNVFELLTSSNNMNILDALNNDPALLHQTNDEGNNSLEVIVKNYPVPMEFVGVKDRFGLSGAPEELQIKFGLTSKEILEASLKVLERKSKGFIGIRKVIEI